MDEAKSGAPGLRAEIVTTGTEILLGEIVDTNAAWIAQQLRDAGVNLYFKTTVGDNEARVRGVLELALSRSDVIVVSGGLGPTKDDITRQAIAAATNCPLVLDESVVETLRERFARFGSTMTENNLQQAMIPQGATIIKNPVGTAPGFIVETEQGTVIALPGVPREMKHLMTETVLPYLRRRGGDTGIIRRRVLRTVGIGESTIDDRLAELMDLANPTVGLAAHTAQCDVRITARAPRATDADQMLDELEAEVRRRIGDTVYSTVPEEPFERVVVRQLAARRATIALLETNTLGQIAARMAQADQTGETVRARYLATDSGLPTTVAAAIAAQPEAKPTEDGTRACATALREATGCDFALVLIGSTGDDEGVYGTSKGETWIALAAAEGVDTLHTPFGGSEAYTVTRMGNQALGVLWQKMKA